MSASNINPIVMFAHSTRPLVTLEVTGVCKKFDLEIRAYIYKYLKSMSWAVVKVDDLGKGHHARTEGLQVEHFDAMEELSLAKQFYSCMVDVYEGALTLEILNAIHTTSETANMGLVHELQEKTKAWLANLRELAGENQFMLRAILVLVNSLETLGEYHAEGINAQLDMMDHHPVVSTIWLDLKTRRLFVGTPNERLEMVS